MEATIESESTETLNQTQTHAVDQLTSLKTALAEKEYAMKNLISTHEKLKTTLRSEIAKLESEKSNLLATLDEANSIREEKEGALTACREEIQRLRSLLSESQSKCKQIAELAQSATESKFRENLLLQFEEERNKVGDQLKWKSEQFTHLEEAHVKLQCELREVKREKEAEQLEFFGKIGRLELNLDEKTRLAEDLRSHLEICNQALAREESKRKLVEAELHESRGRYDCLVTDLEAAKSAVESVTEKRDEEVASLRGILADKSLRIKEIEFEKAQIDLENKELRDSVKEYREIEIGGVEKSKKFKTLEKAHRGCSERIKKREAEIENLKRDLDEKEELVEKLQRELLQMRNGELDNTVTVLRKREENELLEQRVKDCINREKGLVRENDRLICEFREMEGMIKQLNEERERIMKEAEMCKDRLDTSVKEREMLICELGEKNNMVERVKECMDREKGLLRENDRLICEVKEREGETKQLKMEVAQLLERENVRQCVADEEKKQFQMYKDRLDDLVKEKELLLLEVREREGIEQQLSECRNREEVLVREKEKFICDLRERGEVIEGIQQQLRECREREEALLREKEQFICDLREREGIIEGIEHQLRGCREREEGLVREKEKFICELRERGEVIEGIEHQLRECREREEALLIEKEEFICDLRERGEVIEGIGQQLRECRDREEVLLREKEEFICDLRERGEVIEGIGQQLRECRDREEALVREKEEFICDLRESGEVIEGIGQQLRECREREEALLREKEKFISELKERQGLIEELEGNIACCKKHISRLESEVCSLEEERRKFVEIRDEMAKKLLEIKLKLDPLEKKCSQVVKERKSETSWLELNLELLVEELENSISDKEELHLGLQEMATNYFLQNHELEFREGLFCDLEKEMEKVENNMRIKEEKFSNCIKRLMRERETLALQMHDLNCGIGSLLCADGEIKAMIGGILQRMENDGEHVHEKKSKPLVVPLFGTRSPLKENNFY